MSTDAPGVVVRMQDGLIELLGSSVEGRSSLVSGMLHRGASEATSYWLQLVVSVGIATLGLVVGSAAVVIGAMLIAPLMGPIIGLAMGLATGSPFLVLRSAGRIVLSVVVATGGASVITLMLPFHELNAEIAARTSPTALDLVTAGFCALAGVYASLRSGSDTATTAAGTSIGISLVPPLCACGYGFGTTAFPVAGGAALLFLTNLVAIVVVGTVAFSAAGFNRVNVVALEREELLSGSGAPVARAMARRLSRFFESRWGSVLRFLMPFALLAAVYVPLRSALAEVAWQVRTRSAIRDALGRLPARVVQSKIRVERREIEIVLVLVGKTEDAERARASVDADVQHASGVAPRIEVLAVPDATAFAGLESTLLKPRVVETPAFAPPSKDEQLNDARARIRTTMESLWPASAAGDPLVIDVGTMESRPLRIRVVHLGPPMSRDGLEAVQRSVEPALEREVRLIDVAVPSGELTRKDGDLKLVAQVAAGARATAGIASVSVCVTRPAEGPRARLSRSDVDLARAVDEALSIHPRVTTVAGSAWSVRFVQGTCDAGDAGAGDAGPSDAGASDAAR